MIADIIEPKPGVSVGRIVVSVLISNYDDARAAERGQISPDDVRRIEVEALVDSGATFMALPARFVRQLGLSHLLNKEARTVTGPVTLGVYAPARIEVQGRYCVTQVKELPDHAASLLGQIPMEMMDWWIDLKHHKLVGNPEHGGEWMAELY